MKLIGPPSNSKKPTVTGGVPEGAKDAAVQVLEMKRVDSKQQGNAPVRYRLIISDGQHYTQAMLATQLNGLVDDGSEGAAAGGDGGADGGAQRVGGDGGRGGDIVVECVGSLNTLIDFRYQQHFFAKNGGGGFLEIPY